jgi:integrase
MPDVLLSDFKTVVLEQFLKDCNKNGHQYKTLKRQVRNIKTFLRRMNSEGKKPCLDTLDFKIHEFYAIVPSDDSKYFEKVPTVIQDNQVKAILEKLNSEKLKDEDCAMKFGIFTMSLFFGLRRSELLGLKRSHVDLENNLLHIEGIRDRNGQWLNRTKNRGSKRSIELDSQSSKFLKYWLDYVSANYSHSLWLFPSLKKTTYGSLSPKKVSELVWTTYAEMGLAKIERRKDGHVKIIESTFKGAPLKTFRHRLATLLINSMNSEASLDANYIKSVIGHTRFQTTRDRYGNHNLIGTDEERKARIRAKEKALNHNSIFKN